MAPPTMHFEVYVERIAVNRIASPTTLWFGEDTVHQLLAIRRNDRLLSPDKNPEYLRLGGTKNCTEIKDIKGQLNVDVPMGCMDDLTVSILLANIAGEEIPGFMTQILSVLEGRVRNHEVITSGGQSTYGLTAKKDESETEAAVDRSVAKIVEYAGDEVAAAMKHAVDHFKVATKNHDCVLLYATVVVKAPGKWKEDETIRVTNLQGVPAGLTKGNPNYTLDLVVKRQKKKQQ